MTLTKIFTGMEKGPEMIDKNFNDNLLEISSWTDVGITYVNGFSEHTNDMANTLKYRTIKLGGMLIYTEFSGYFNNPALNSSQGIINICNLPSNILKSGFSRESNSEKNLANESGFLSFGISGSALRINIWEITKNLTAGEMRINYGIEW
ncbi:hypothetical protein AB0Y04_04735 [Loigolactobacillus coryniformis]|uniref:hypothetical protein n=1 Tax=Loigolactobacillus coryniformis TaxID=1610 RepID=UPI003F223DB7